MGFDDTDLIDKALTALIRFMESHKEGPLTKRETALLRFTLAFLYRGGDRKAYETFFQAARQTTNGTASDEFGRLQQLRAAYGMIAREHGRDYW